MAMWFENLVKLTPTPQRWLKHCGHYRIGETARFAFSGVDRPERSLLWTMLKEDVERLLKRPAVLVSNGADADVRMALRPEGTDVLPAEGYSLRATPAGVRLAAGTERGLFYGAQTLTQLMAIGRRANGIPLGEILDWPHYANRCVMVDAGRAPWTPALLRRVTRICARLKYNVIHFHGNDNELNAVRYEGTPLGTENPFAMPFGEYAKWMDYAAGYHVRVVPEVESWGHAGSFLQHYPRLYGATRPHGYGHALAIGPATFDLLRKIYDPWMAILPDGEWFHVGMDEANWRLLPGAGAQTHNRRTLVRLIYDLVQERAAAHGKTIRMMMWDDRRHPPGFIPPDLRDEIIAEPWNYHTAADVARELGRQRVLDHKRFRPDGRLRAPFVSGGGVSGIHELGALEATLQWALQAKNYPNCLGLDVTLWGTNDLASRMTSIYHGADCAWNPIGAREALPQDAPHESSYGELTCQAKLWQAAFPDAEPDAINRDRGEDVLHGLYRWGAKAGQPVAPVWMPEAPILGDTDAVRPDAGPARDAKE